MPARRLTLKDRAYKKAGAIEEMIFDRWFNIGTRSQIMHAEQGAEHNDLHAYIPTPYDLLFRLIHRLDLRPDDVVYDVGCGSGRVVCTFARYPVKRCVGA